MTIDINETNLDFGDGDWRRVDTLPSYESVGVSHLSPPRQARYVAVVRIGVINLKEVKVYRRASKKLID